MVVFLLGLLRVISRSETRALFIVSSTNITGDRSYPSDRGLADAHDLERNPISLITDILLPHGAPFLQIFSPKGDFYIIF